LQVAISAVLTFNWLKYSHRDEPRLVHTGARANLRAFSVVARRRIVELKHSEDV